MGQYSALEEIDLADYLAVRGRAVSVVADADPYAALLVSLHTYNLLADRADRTTIAATQLPLLDAFLDRQRLLQQQLHSRISLDTDLMTEQASWTRIQEHFRLLQATDNLSLLSCVVYRQPASLLHPLPLVSGGHQEVKVESLGERHFRLSPYPFCERELTFELPARHVEGKCFGTVAELQEHFHAASVCDLSIRVSS